jgi:predicted glycosyl hydrolase (DUF1957 family)
MYWANFLHIYQPPTQTEEIVRKVSRESYSVLVRTLQKSPQAKITLNINAALTEQLARYKLGHIIDGLRELAERGQIEFTGSAMYHPILPLIPRDEAIRQIEINSEVNRRYFGQAYNPQGFFPPEMCFSPDVAEMVAVLGFKWMIIDEISLCGKIGQSRSDVIYGIQNNPNFSVFFKERPFSSGLSYGKYPTARPFLEALESKLPTRSYLLTGTDGEIYGHHRRGQERLLEQVYENGEPKTCTISELAGLFPERENVSPLPSSWSTWEDEMSQHIPYPQWDYPAHRLHRLQWKLTNLALDLVRSVGSDTAGYQEARHLLDEGLHSDQFWWASCRPWWSTGMIESGARKLFESVSRVRQALPPGKYDEASASLDIIVEESIRWEKTGEAKRRRDEYLEEHPEVTSELTFGKRQSS